MAFYLTVCRPCAHMEADHVWDAAQQLYVCLHCTCIKHRKVPEPPRASRKR